MTQLPISLPKKDVEIFLVDLKAYLGLPDERFQLVPDPFGKEGTFTVTISAKGSASGWAIDFTNGWVAGRKWTGS